jgi:hypothetical protein
MKRILSALLTLTSVGSNQHPDARWFPDAGLGLFIHWGLASVGATGDLSWGMLANKPWKDQTVTPNTYYTKIDLIWFDGGKGVAYLHFLPSFNEDVIWENAPEYQKASLLRTGEAVSISYQHGNLRITLPAARRSASVEVVKLE